MDNRAKSNNGKTRNYGDISFQYNEEYDRRENNAVTAPSSWVDSPHRGGAVWPIALGNEEALQPWGDARTLPIPGTHMISPYSCYGEARALLEDKTAGSTPGIFEKLSAIFSRLAEINDFSGIGYLFDRYKPDLPQNGELDHTTEAVNFLLKGAQAKLRCGDSAEAARILEGVVAQQPAVLTSRRLLASLLRIRSPGAALQLLREARHQTSFQTDLPSVVTYLDLLAQNRLFGAARAEALALHSGVATSEILLALANLETVATDKLALLNSYLALEKMDPLSLRPSAATMTVDDFLGDARPASGDGPLVSVVMTTFNSVRWVQAAIASLRAQTYGNWELLVVDDGSADATPQLLQDYVAADARIRVIAKADNGGTYAAKNLGLLSCKGEFVTCHDSDDFAHPQRLERQLRHLQQNQDSLANITRWVRVDGYGNLSLKFWGMYSHDNPASLMFRREFVLQNLGFFDSARVGADTEFRQRLRARYGWSALANLRDVAAIGRQHASSLTASGAGATDEFGFAPARQLYNSAWLDWHEEQFRKSGPFRRDLDPDKAAFAIPANISSAADPDALEITGAEGPQAPSFARFAPPPAEPSIADAEATPVLPPDEQLVLPKGAIVHAADLNVDGPLLSLLLNQVSIELEIGAGSIVWNVAAIEPTRFAWQIKRLAIKSKDAVALQPPDGVKLMFVYGPAALQKVVDDTAGVAPADQVRVLTRTAAEAAKAADTLASLGWKGVAQEIDTCLFEGREPRDVARKWATVLFQGLFNGPNETAPAQVEAIGLSFYGRTIGEDDIVLLQKIKTSTKKPVVVLVDDGKQDAILRHGFEVCLAKKGRNFWNDFFGRATLLVETKLELDAATMTDAVGQAISRSRVVALLGDREAGCIGVKTFADEKQLLSFLKELSKDSEQFFEAQVSAEEQLRESIGTRFHRARLQQILDTMAAT